MLFKNEMFFKFYGAHNKQLAKMYKDTENKGGKGSKCRKPSVRWTTPVSQDKTHLVRIGRIAVYRETPFYYDDIVCT